MIGVSQKLPWILFDFANRDGRGLDYVPPIGSEEDMVYQFAAARFLL
jgi:hypothetical protein